MTDHRSEWVQLIASIIAALAAINWATVEFFAFDLLTDIVELAGNEYKAAVAVVAIAGVLVAIRCAENVGSSY